LAAVGDSWIIWESLATPPLPKTEPTSATAPPREDVQAELERIANSPGFRQAERCLRLLRHVTTLALDGRRVELKEYSLGLTVFERPESFDPRVDPIVRQEMRRLRLKLAEYYQGEGNRDPLIIDLPKGTYVPEFRSREPLNGAWERRTPPTPIRRPRTWLLASIVATLCIAAVGIVYAVNRRANSRVRSLAVLPLRDNSARHDLAYLADGLRDGLISAMVRTRGLEVTARVSSGQIANTPDNLVESVRRVQADAVVSGSVNDAQVILALLDPKTGKYLWSKTYPVTPRDLPAIEHSAASDIARALGVFAEVPQSSLPQNPEAAELYLRACSLSRTRLQAQMKDAAQLFERVVALEPQFAPAAAAAASNYLVGAQNSVLRWSDVGKRGIELARRAVDLDPALADAHAALALAFQAQWQWKEADAELRRAIELDPRSPVPHFRRAYTLIVLRRFSEAQAEIEAARSLDPAWPASHGLLGELYFYQRRYDDALELSRRLRNTSPEFFDSLAARVYVAQNRWEAALPLFAKSATPFERDLARAAAGDVSAAYQDLVKGYRDSSVPAYHVACFSVLQLHDQKITLDWLEKAFADHDPDLVSLALDPMFDGIRQTPRAAALLKQLNL
jgi:TolB-like protein